MGQRSEELTLVIKCIDNVMFLSYLLIGLFRQ